MEIIDLVLDWDFFIEINKTEQEPIQSDEVLKLAIFVFAIIGSVTFVLEFISMCLDIRADCKYLTYSTVMSFISTWIEDFSQIVLAVRVAVLSSELISNVQIAKAIYAIIEATIHIGISFWQLCCKDDYKRNSSCLQVLIVLNLIGSFLILGCSGFLLYELYEDNFHSSTT